MTTLNQPLVSKYQRNRDEIPLEKRIHILNFLKQKRFLSASRIAEILNVKHQTVRCWLSQSNPRNISTDALKSLCDFFGYDPYKDFE